MISLHSTSFRYPIAVSASDDDDDDLISEDEVIGEETTNTRLAGGGAVPRKRGPFSDSDDEVDPMSFFSNSQSRPPRPLFIAPRPR